MRPSAGEALFFSSRRRHTRCGRDWSSDVCSSDLIRSDVPILQIIEDKDISYDIDVEEMYYTKVKIIYGKIIKYATLSESEFTLSPPLFSVFSSVKYVSRNNVVFIKNTMSIHKNVIKY